MTRLRPLVPETTTLLGEIARIEGTALREAHQALERMRRDDRRLHRRWSHANLERNATARAEYERAEDAALEAALLKRAPQINRLRRKMERTEGKRIWMTAIIRSATPTYSAASAEAPKDSTARPRGSGT